MYKRQEFIRKQKRVESRDFPLDILYISYIEHKEKYPELEENVITTNMIYNALAKVYNGTFEKQEDGLLNSLDLFNSTIEAKEQALKYSLDINQVARILKGEIQLEDVVNYYNKLLPQIKSVSQEIVSQLEYGILNKDIKLLKRFIKLAEKQLINEENEHISKLIEEGQDILNEDEILKKQGKEKDTNKEINKERLEKDQEQEKLDKEKEVLKVTYTVQRRRRRKD